MRSTPGIAIIALIASFLLFFGNCKSFEEERNELPDTFDRGTIYVSADESFKPIIDAQVEVYEGSLPDTRIIVDYKPEAECLKDFATDSVRVIIATRGFTQSEENLMIDSLKVAPIQQTIARDAIAVIVNPMSPDTVFTMAELKQILTGKFTKKLIPVFDGVKATSTVRFIVDSVLQSDYFSRNTVAARTSEGVIDYVSKTPDAIGFIGVSWIGNKEDTAQMNFLKKVKVAWLESTEKPGRFVLPYQINISSKIYPMVRDLVYTLKENHRGLGTGFTEFMAQERGQLVFKRAYLAPAQRSFYVRKVRVTE
jgi:phosphate transport system substrate-binding protein